MNRIGITIHNLTTCMAMERRLMKAGFLEILQLLQPEVTGMFRQGRLSPDYDMGIRAMIIIRRCRLVIMITAMILIINSRIRRLGTLSTTL
jgi:hypothetical protein